MDEEIKYVEDLTPEMLTELSNGRDADEDDEEE